MPIDSTTGSDDSLGDIHRLLSHSMRRSLLRLLRETDETKVETLSTKLVEVDENISAGMNGEEGAERIELLLHHTHLPKLADFGILEYDRSAGEVKMICEANNVYEVLDGYATGSDE